MTKQQHPITPPLELVRQWRDKWRHDDDEGTDFSMFLATQAARWGADQELEACVEWLMAQKWFNNSHIAVIKDLRAARRPKPPSLAEQGHRILVENGSTLDGRVELDPEDVDTIRAALKRLQELENGNE